jgi:hypothetical protein
LAATKKSERLPDCLGWASAIEFTFDVVIAGIGDIQTKAATNAEASSSPTAKT